jgi:glutathione peroxidase
MSRASTPTAARFCSSSTPPASAASPRNTPASKNCTGASGIRDFVVLGFPCNQFGEQEPGDAEAIGQFCQTRFDVTFPLFAKIDVNGDNAHPLYAWLKHEAAGILGTEAIKWNFTKFLVDREGKVVHRYAPATRPEELVEAVEALL